jgi:hypothetical protein
LVEKVKLLLALEQEQADVSSRHRAMEAKIERAEQELQQAAAAYQAYRQEWCFLLQNLQTRQATLDTLPPCD